MLRCLFLAITVNSYVIFTDLGMAGAGKTSFTRQLSRKVVDGSRPYIINLDPACREVPYPANIGQYWLRMLVFLKYFKIVLFNYF